MEINLRLPIVSFVYVYPLNICHPISFSVVTTRMPTTSSKLGGRIQALATIVIPVTLTNAWTAPRRTHTCARLLKVPSLGKINCWMWVTESWSYDLATDVQFSF
jgi:hypothetical protein